MTRRTDAAQTPDLWEVVGLRILGMETPVLGAIRFRRQEGDSRARCSLSSYLSAPPLRRDDLREQRLAPSVLPVAVKPGSLGFQSFLSRLNQGERFRMLTVAIDTIQVAFDFRRENPSVERSRHRFAKADEMIFRTIEGHVLSGSVHAFTERLHKAETFLGMSEARQHTEAGALELPNLILHRGFLSVAASRDEPGVEDEPVFVPLSTACSPLIGRPAWRFFQGRRESETSTSMVPGDSKEALR